MNIVKCFFNLLIGWTVCSQSLNNLVPSLPIESYSVTAVVDDSSWFGSVTARKSFYHYNYSACDKDQVDLYVLTDLPYEKVKRLVTGCVDGCEPTQQLHFHNLPLAVGKYSLSALSLCAGENGIRLVAEYWWMIGNDVIIRNYGSRTNSRGWIEVTSYDSSQQLLEGTFEMDLIDYDKQVARFRKGIFKTRISQ